MSIDLPGKRIRVSDTGDVPLPFPEDLDDTLSAWRLRGMASGHSGRTIDGRAYTIARLARDLDPLTVSGDELESWLAGLPLARSSRATYRSHLRAWFGWLVESGRRGDDPSLRLPKPRAPRGLPRPVSPADVQAILAACADPRARQTAAYVILGAYAGLRVHEIAKVSGEDLRGNEILVVGKGGVTATVPLVPAIARLAAALPEAGWWFPSTAPSGHVHRCSVSSAISRAMRRAGVPGTPHALRHYYCTQVLRSTGGDLRKTQRLARHASPATTAGYTQILDEELMAAAASIPGAA